MSSNNPPSSNSYSNPSASSYTQPIIPLVTVAPSAQATNLHDLITTKQNELTVLNAYQTSELIRQNEQLTQALAEQQQRYTNLKTDFQYNLELIRSRDAELQKYDELSVTYAKTLEGKQNEFLAQLRQSESQLDAKNLQLADLTETYQKLRESYQGLQEQLSSTTWAHETEIRTIKHNHQAALREVEAKLSSKDEIISKNQYELMHNFERATEQTAAEAQDKIDKANLQIKTLQTQIELQTKDLQRSAEKLAVEQHKRQQLEQRLDETNTKLIASEGTVAELRAALVAQDHTHKEEVAELNATNEALVKKCVNDYKSLASTSEKVQDQFLQQTEAHQAEMEKFKKDTERNFHELHKNYGKQLAALQHDLELTQQQLRDSQTLSQTVQQELDSYVTAEQARTASLNDNLSQFQSQHSKQIQDLNLAIWKSEEERKSLQEKNDLLKKNLDDRRSEIGTMKETLSNTERKLEELERNLTEQKLKADRDRDASDELVASLKLQLKAASTDLRRVQSEKEAQITNYQHAQAMIGEYQQQLKSVREELLQMHTQENVALEKRISTEYPAIQYQLQEVGIELNNLGANMAGFTPYQLSPTSQTSTARPSPINSRPNSARPIISSQPNSDRERDRDRPQLRPSQSSNRPMHLSRISEIPSDAAVLAAMDDTLSPNPATQARLSSTESQPSQTGQETAKPVDGQSQSNATPATAKPSTSSSSSTAPPKTVTALSLNMNSDSDMSHQPVDIETSHGTRSHSNMKAARKQSITSPNINLNGGQASLESLDIPQSITESKQDGGGGDDSDSSEDFVEHPLSDSSLDNSRTHLGGEFKSMFSSMAAKKPTPPTNKTTPSPTSMIVQSLPIQESMEEHLSAELVQDPVESNLSPSQPNPSSDAARPFSPTFSEDMGPVSVPNSLPNSPAAVKPGQQPQQQQQTSATVTAAARQLHINQIPPLPIPPQPYDESVSHQYSDHNSDRGDSQRSSRTTISYTSSQRAHDKTVQQYQRENATLQQQNSQLSQIIREMKKELETFMNDQQRQAKLDEQAAKELPAGAAPGTISLPGTQYRSMQIQLQTQAQTLTTQTKQLEEQRTVYQKLQFHHALLLAELESVQQHLPPAIIAQHITAELTFLRTYTRELNATITNLKTELMYLQAQHQHSSVVLDNKHQQTILLHSQTQQIEQQQIALQFKDHKIYELESELQARTREREELKQQLTESHQRLALITQQAQQEATALRQYQITESLKQQQLLFAQQQQQQQQPQQAQPAALPQPSQPIPPSTAAYPPQSVYPSQVPFIPSQQQLPMDYGYLAHSNQPQPLSQPVPQPLPQPQPPSSRRSRTSSISPSRDSARSRSRSRSNSRKKSSGDHEPDSTGDSTLTEDLSLSGHTVHPSDVGRSRRDLPTHASDRATESQQASSRSIRVRAEILRAKDLAVKARADAARARVREQMKRMKEVEQERQREALTDEHHYPDEYKEAAVDNEDRENNPWRSNEQSHPITHRTTSKVSISVTSPTRSRSTSSRPTKDRPQERKSNMNA